VALSEKQKAETLAAYQAGGSAEQAALILGIAASTMKRRLYTIGIRPADRSPPEKTPFVEPPPQKPRVIVRAYSASPDGDPVRVCLIGDTHIQPGMPNDRMTWIGRHIAATKPDKVIHLGDLGEWSSCSRHEMAGSLAQKIRPSFKNDLDAVEDGLAKLYKEIEGVSCHITLGNHDARPQILEAGTAELEGALWPQVTDLLARYDWRWYDYRQFLFVGGVGCTHVPQTLLERPYGGKTLQPLANDLVFSLVFGHRHRFDFVSAPKIGPQQRVEILNPGCAMPHGYFPSYNASQQGGITWGITDATFQGGHITSHHFIPMTYLEERYS
jgi:predicted phosphodiesterase